MSVVAYAKSMKLVFIAFLLFMSCCISLFILFDEILKFQHKNYYSDWLADGKPHGFFFKPEETKTFFGMPGFGSWFAMQRRCFALTWKTPNWADKEPRIIKLISWYRILNVIAFAVWLLFAYTGIYQI